MAARLFSLCWLEDGVHWLLIAANGVILDRSPFGFATEVEAMLDLKNQHKL
ncbi:MAG: hypothetical protein K2X68_00510 [Novosphingobium sp.]|nr:hypothetical protein [Novosphingobium sp.]